MKKVEYKTWQENYEETLAEARQATTTELRHALGHDRGAYHGWAIKAFEQAMVERCSSKGGAR